MNYYVYENTLDFSCSLMDKRGKFDMLCQHYHSEYEILFMLDGERYIFVNNGTHKLTAGDIVMIKPYKLHFTENRESEYFKRYVLSFSDKILKSILSEEECLRLTADIHTGVIHLDADAFAAVKTICEDLSGHDYTKDRFLKKKLAAKILTLLDILKNISSPRSLKDSADLICSDNLAGVLNYINRHFNEDLTLDLVVQYAHMSKANFCRVFKRETGNTFLQYLNNLRVAYAHSLLVETDMQIQKISEKAGFSSLLHFERVFKNAHGITPSAVRKKV